MVACACVLSALTCALADSPHRIDIPAGDLRAALDLLARQSGVEFVYSADQLEGLRTQGVHGELTAEKAVAKLLEGTKLILTVHPSGAILIAPPPSPRSRDTTKDDAGATNAATQSIVRPIWDRIRLALIGAGQAVQGSTAGGGSGKGTSSGGDTLAEIIVTASKRREPLSKVGAAVSAISGDELEEREASSLRDYVAFIPGVSLQSLGSPGYGVVSIRGVAPQSVGAATATYVDEVPFGPSSALTEGGLFTLDLNPVDLERVEVLKGPQGTLYGASSLGGLIKYVTRAPDLQHTEIRLQEDVNAVQDGSPGTKMSGSISAPLIENQLGVRLSGYYQHTGGFIDDLGIGGEDTNRGNARGFHGAVLYKPLDDLSVRLDALTQDSAVNGQTVVDYNLATGRPVNGNLTQYRYLPEPFSVQIRLYSANIHYDLGKVELVSATSYSSLHPLIQADGTAIYEALGYPFATPQTPVGTVGNFPTSQVTEELRLVSARMGIVEWMLGGFYQHEALHDALDITQYVNGAPNPELLPGDAYRVGALTEYAVFSNATLYLGSKFDVTLGFRDSHISQSRLRRADGLLYNPTDPSVFTTSYQKFTESSNTYLASARYRVTDDTLLYARAASGYRPGGGRTVPAGAPAGFPDYYTSDSLWSYEAGFKMRELQGRLTLDTDAFWINWSNIQTLQPVGGLTVDGNAGTAVSRGVEAQIDYVVFKGLDVGMNSAFTDAHFTQSVASIDVTDGERLYYVPKWTATAYTEYSRPVAGGWSGFAGGDYQYQSQRLDSNRNPLPSFSIWNVHFGVRNDQYRANFYVNNLTDKIALTGSNNSAVSGAPHGFAINTPRTFGITVALRF
jgi:iron complex outermembrane recepter protein